MLSTYSKLQIVIKGKISNGFCMRIQDDFHETYAVILDGYHSFCIWLDDRSEKWCASKYALIDDDALNQIVYKLSITEPSA